MRCPYCGESKDKVVDSRATEEGRAIRRRRHCLKCERRFTTYEHVEERKRMTVVKKDGTRVPFDRQNIYVGLERSCYKRPVSSETIQKLVEAIEEEIFRTHDAEIGSIEIGRNVSERLKRVDHIAYVRFASVYKEFHELDEFVDEVRMLESHTLDRPEQGLLFKNKT